MGKRVLLIAIFIGLMGLLGFGSSIARANDLLLDPDIQITAPAAGETLIAGETYEIRWSTPSDADYLHVGMFGHRKIYYSVDGGNVWVLAANSGSLGVPNPYSWKVPSVVTDTARIRIQIVDDNSNMSLGPWGMSLVEDDVVEEGFYNDTGDFTIRASSGNPRPTKPTGLTAAPVSGNTIDLRWTDCSSDETAFYILRKNGNDEDYVNIGSVDKNTTKYQDTGLNPKTEYYYVVRSYNSELFSGFSSSAKATTPELTIPSIPSALKATAVSTSEIDLVWKDNSNSESSFKLERSLKQVEGYSEITSIPANTTSYKDTGLGANTTYYYRVKADNSAGGSDYSPIASAKTMSDNQSAAPPTAAMVMKFTANQNRCDINGVFHRMSAAPVIKDTRVLLPIRYVAAPLGATVDWNAKSKKVTISLNGTVLELWINNNTAKVNGIAKPIDNQNASVTPVIVPPGSTMLPLRFIAENLGCDVNWDPVKKEAIVTYPKI